MYHLPSQLILKMEQIGKGVGVGVFIEDKMLQGQVTNDLGDEEKKRKYTNWPIVC